MPDPYGPYPGEHYREPDIHDVESSLRARLGPLLDGAEPGVTNEPDRRSRVMVTAVRDTAPTTKTIRDVLLRVQGEYRDMPGLKLTEAQAQRLLGIDCDTCTVVLSALIERRFLRRTAKGTVRSRPGLTESGLRRFSRGGIEHVRGGCPRDRASCRLRWCRARCVHRVAVPNAGGRALRDWCQVAQPGAAPSSASGRHAPPGRSARSRTSAGLARR